MEEWQKQGWVIRAVKKAEGRRKGGSFSPSLQILRVQTDRAVGVLSLA